jgi:hypothetical protein
MTPMRIRSDAPNTRAAEAAVAEPRKNLRVLRMMPLLHRSITTGL